MLYLVSHTNGRRSHCENFAKVREALARSGPGRVTLLRANPAEIDKRIDEILNRSR